jgi:hypothetical protein
MVVQLLDGRFWIADAVGLRRSGVLRLENGEPPNLVVHGALTPMMRRVDVSGTGDDAIAVYEPAEDYTPRTIFGTLRDGTQVTLLQAQSRGHKGGFKPDDQVEELAAIHAVLGAHLTGRDHQLSGFRVRIQGAGRMLSRTSHPSWQKPTTLKEGGSIRLSDEGNAWLTLEHLPPRSIRGLDRQYLRPLCTLISLAIGRKVGLLELQVQQGVSMAWWPVHSAAHQPDDVSVSPSALLAPGDITPTVATTWLDEVERLGPLPPIVASASGPITLEAEVLALTTVAEGLHRRLCPNAFRFSEEVGSKVREAASVAAEAVQPGAGKTVRGYLNFVHQVGYGQRLLDLAETVQAFMPDVTGHTSRWKSAVYNTRNDFAHRAHQGWFEDSDYDKYLTVALSLRWLLRGVLLARAGFSTDLLATRFRAHQEYQLFLNQAKEWQPNIYATTNE